MSLSMTALDESLHIAYDDDDDDDHHHCRRRHRHQAHQLIREAYSGGLFGGVLLFGELIRVSSLIRETYSGEVSYSGSLFGVIRAYSGSYSGRVLELFGQSLGVIRAESWSSGAYSGTDLFSGVHSGVACLAAPCKA